MECIIGGINMQIQEKQVILRKLVASEGKILVSKTLDSLFSKYDSKEVEYTIPSGNREEKDIV